MPSNKEIEVIDAAPTNGQLAPREPAGPIARIPGASPIETIIQTAMERDADPGTMRELLALYKDMKALSAVEQFNAAFSAFKAECPPVIRRTENTQFKVTRNGVSQNRRYASLEDIEATTRPILGKHGLSYRWGNTVVADGLVKMDCIVSHQGGHSVTSPVSIPVDSRAGCSDQQKFGSAMTYAQRYSLIQALGLTSCDEDNDGNDTPPPDEPKITAEQAANLQTMIDEVKPDMPKFLKWAGITKIADMPVSMFPQAIDLLERRRANR